MYNIRQMRLWIRQSLNLFTYINKHLNSKYNSHHKTILSITAIELLFSEMDPQQTEGTNSLQVTSALAN